ncbi:MAG: hypothetical protein ACK559_34190, partial [bacterium]
AQDRVERGVVAEGAEDAGVLGDLLVQQLLLHLDLVALRLVHLGVLLADLALFLLGLCALAGVGVVVALLLVLDLLLLFEEQLDHVVVELHVGRGGRRRHDRHRDAEHHGHEDHEA